MQKIGQEIRSKFAFDTHPNVQEYTLLIGHGRATDKLGGVERKRAA